MSDTPDKRISIAPPSGMTVLAARHLDATEGPVQVGAVVDTATLVLELVHDWRPDPTTAVRALPEHELHAIIRKMARIDPPWFRSVAQTMDRIARGENTRAVLGDSAPARGEADTNEDDEEPVSPAKPDIPRCTATWTTPDGTARCWRRAIHNQRAGYETHMGETEQGYRWQWIGTEPGATPHRPELDDTVCTPIPAATLMQLSEVPPELRTEPAGVTPLADDPPVQCWHYESGSPCDWDVCRQPERLAAGDRGTDPARTASGEEPS